MTKKTEVFKPKSTKYENYFLYFMPILSGILIGTSYIPFPAWALGFCYLPLWWSVLKITETQETLPASQNKSYYQKIFTQGWLTQFILSLIGFNWLYYTASEFGQLSSILSLIILILFAAFIHLYIPIALLIASYLKKKFKLKKIAFIFVIALCQILMERIWPSIFEWNLGYTLLWMKWPLAQWADTVGFWGLSAWIFIFQAVLLVVIIFFKKNRLKSLSLMSTLLITTLSLWWWGQKKYHQVTRQLTEEVKVSIVQANVTNEEKLQSEKGYQYQGYVINTYIETTKNHLQTHDKPDFILWPETALPISLDQNFHQRPNQKIILDQLKFWQTNLVTGAYSQDLFKTDHLGQYLIRNSVFFLNQNGEVTPPYNKTDLLVFGEYMPLGEEMPFLYKLLPFVGTYERGPGPVIKTIIKTNGEQIHLGPQICYESLNPGFSRKLAKLGTDVIFNLTNDSWFGWWAEPYQHMIMTLARGLENRRPLVRSTNTGISTVLLANGDELPRSPIGEIWAGQYTVKYQKNPEITFYARLGYLDWILWLLWLCFILLRGRHAHTQKS